LYGGEMDEKGRIIYEPDLDKLRKDFFAVCVNDEATRKTISATYRKYKVILEPHGAVAWSGIESFLEIEEPAKEQLIISLETAHPSKFMEEVKKIVGFIPPVHDSLKDLESRKEHFTTMDSNYEQLKEYILKN